MTKGAWMTKEERRKRQKDDNIKEFLIFKHLYFSASPQSPEGDCGGKIDRPSQSSAERLRRGEKGNLAED